MVAPLINKPYGFLMPGARSHTSHGHSSRSSRADHVGTVELGGSRQVLFPRLGSRV